LKKRAGNAGQQQQRELHAKKNGYILLENFLIVNIYFHLPLNLTH